MSCRMLHSGQSLAFSALGLFCINIRSTMAPGQSQLAGVPATTTKAPIKQDSALFFFLILFLLTKVYAVLNAKLQQMENVLS